MHWEETLLKNIKWEPLPIEYTDDNRTDILLRVPITNLLKAQARRSFLAGMGCMFLLFSNPKTKEKPITADDLSKLFTDGGYPEVVEKLKKKKEVNAVGGHMREVGLDKEG